MGDAHNINVTGSTLMGLTVGVLIARAEIPPEVRVFLATGILGGYTTFSAFSLDVWMLAERAQILAAGSYILASVAFSVAGFGPRLVAAKFLVP